MLPTSKQRLGEKVPARLILRTGWSEYFGDMKFYNEYPFLSENAARWLVEQGRAADCDGHAVAR